MTGLAILVFCVLPTDDVARDRCTTIEVNHVFDGCGNRVFTQQIFWQAGDVRAWRLMKHDGEWPERDYQRGGYVTTFHRGERLYEVRSPIVRETFTQFDVEVLERDRLPVHHRRRMLFEKQP